jgi:hypothetical protein
MLAETATFATGLIVGAALVVAGLDQILQAVQDKPWGGLLEKTQLQRSNDILLSKSDQFCTNRIPDQFSRR